MRHFLFLITGEDAGRQEAGRPPVGPLDPFGESQESIFGFPTTAWSSHPGQVTELIKSGKNGRVSFASDTIKYAQIPELFNKSQNRARRSQKATASIFNYGLFITDTLLLIVFQEPCQNKPELAKL